MKNKNARNCIKGLAFAMFLCLSFFACDKQNQVNLKDSNQNKNIEKRILSADYTLIDGVNNFEMVITFYENGGNSLDNSDEAIISDYLVEMFPSLDIGEPVGIEVLYAYSEEEKETITLFGYGEDSNGRDVPVAVAFNGNGDGLGGVIDFRATGGGGGTTHSCSGSPCNCCDFLYEITLDYTLFGQEHKSGKIVGCECRTVPARCATINGTCNHTKTSN